MANQEKITSLQDLAVNHPYYCNDSNFYSNESHVIFETCSEFLAGFSDADIDWNHCFRWDVKLKDDENPALGYKAMVFIMMQRKGIFLPITINNIYEDNVEAFVAYLQKHADHQKLMWMPIT